MLGRAWRWIVEQFAFLVVVLLLAAAFGYLTVDPGRWSRVTGIVALAMLVAGFARLTLPTDRVGMLAVRGRAMDTVCFLFLGALILALDIRLHG